jgi:hypothetical protein
MSGLTKKTALHDQQGLPNLGNTCYINTAIQTLLSYPDLFDTVTRKRLQLNTAAHLPGGLDNDGFCAQLLCQLLTVLLAKQQGVSVDQAAFDDAWALFIQAIRTRITDNRPLGAQQEDSSFALGMLFELLHMPAPLEQHVTKKYASVTVDIRDDGGAIVYSQTYAEMTAETERLPCPRLNWKSGQEFIKLFEPTDVELTDATHPLAYADNHREPTPCTETTQVVFQGTPTAFCVLPDHAVRLSEQDASRLRRGERFAPTECRYDFRSEVTLTIQGQPVTYVLASFGQKIGGAGGGHYIAYRREGEHWYEIDDGSVTPKGQQAFDKPHDMPEGIVSALSSTRAHCARQLVYVEKKRFRAQYTTTPDVVVPTPVVPTEDDEVIFQKKLQGVLVQSGKEHTELEAKTKQAQEDLTVALKRSEAEQIGAVDIFPQHLREMIEQDSNVLSLGSSDGNRTIQAINLENDQNWKIIVAFLNYNEKVSEVKICCAGTNDTTKAEFNTFLKKELKQRKGKVKVSISFPPAENADAEKNDQPGNDTTQTYGKSDFPAKRWIWRGVLVLAAVAGVGVLAAASMGIGLGILACVCVAIGADRFWQSRNRRFKETKLTELKQLALTNNVDSILLSQLKQGSQLPAIQPSEDRQALSQPGVDKTIVHQQTLTLNQPTPQPAAGKSTTPTGPTKSILD